MADSGATSAPTMSRRTVLKGVVGAGALLAPLGTAARAVAVPHDAAVLATGLQLPWGLVFVAADTALVGEIMTCDVYRVTRVGTRTLVGRVAGATRLMSMALSPTFASDRLVYAFIVTASENQVVSMTYDGSTLGPPRVVFGGIPMGLEHFGGALAFAPDGMLHVGVGDQGHKELARDMTSLAGKTLRIRPDGTVPADNPSGTAVWTSGHRNVEGMAFSGGTLYATEFGESAIDELNVLVGGADYGWSDVEGGDGPGPFQDPVTTWTPTSYCSPAGVAITGGYAFVGALAGRALFQVDLGAANPGQTVRHLFDVYGRIRTVAVAPDGALWFTTGNNSVSFPHTTEDDRVVRVLPGLATTAPTDVRAAVVSAGSATLTWAPPVDYGASAVTGYRVERTAGSAGGTGWSTTVAATARSQTFNNLVAGSTYSLLVSAVNAQGVGPASTVAVTMSGSGAPGVATGVAAAAASSTSATLSWAAPSSSGSSAVTGYRVARDAGSAGGTAWATTVAASARSQTFLNLVPGSTYSLSVAAINAQGTGPTTAVPVTVSAGSAPGAPVIGTAAAGTAGGAVTATARWSPPASTGGSAVTGYRVRALRMSSTGTVLGTTLSAWAAATARSLAMTLPQTGSYRFTVEARNTVGTGPQSSLSNQVAGR